MHGGRREYTARFIGGVIRSTFQNRPSPDSPVNFPEVGEGLSGYCSTPSFGQMKLPALLALNTGDRAIGDSLVSVSIQGYPN